MNSIGVLALMHNQPILRSGVQACVALDPGLKWLEPMTPEELANPGLLPPSPDVVLIDADMAAPGSQAELDVLQRQRPSTRLVLLKGLPAERGTHFDSLAARAACVLDKSASPRELVAAIQSAHRGESELQLAQKSVSTHKKRAHLLGEDLTRRERDLLKLLAQGLSNRDIAKQLDISVSTVKFHVTHILDKLDADNRTTAVLLSLRYGLLEDR